jgi:hypothetical protein
MPTPSARASGLAPASYMEDDNVCSPDARDATSWNTETYGWAGGRRSQDGGREREPRTAPDGGRFYRDILYGAPAGGTRGPVAMRAGGSARGDLRVSSRAGVGPAGQGLHQNHARRLGAGRAERCGRACGLRTRDQRAPAWIALRFVDARRAPDWADLTTPGSLPDVPGDRSGVGWPGPYRTLHQRRKRTRAAGRGVVQRGLGLAADRRRGQGRLGAAASGAVSRVTADSRVTASRVPADRRPEGPGSAASCRPIRRAGRRTPRPWHPG